MSTFTERIAGFIKQVSYHRLPAAAIDMSKRSIIDCLGVAVAGGAEDAARIISEYTKDNGKPEAGVISGGHKTSAEQAAWVNGTKAHALDYDDYFAPNHSTPYHPTVAILPAILAVGEKLHISGKEVLLAYVTGFEVEARIAVVCAKQQYNLGWHTTSTLGSIGAAAAVAKMLKLDEEKIKIALGIASSLAGGLRKNFGTMTKPLHAGNAARNGVIAATLAQRGFTADKNVLDSPLSFGEVMGGEAETELAKANQGTKAEFYIVSTGIALKPYPSCAYSHWAIDAALDLRKEAAITADNIIEVECQTSSALPDVLIYSHPATDLEGKFSLEFCTAVALVDGSVSLNQFTNEKVKDPAVQELMKRVKYAHPSELGAGLTYMGGKLLVKLRDGKIYSRQVDAAKGNPENPLNMDELINKYRDCVRTSLSTEDANKSLDLLLHLESIRDISELMDIFTFKARQ
ncbi:MmgE/PrpD family protein [Chloroflexota bacterium]